MTNEIDKEVWRVNEGGKEEGTEGNGLMRKRVKEEEMKGRRGRDKGRRALCKEGWDVKGESRKKWTEVMREDYAGG